MFESTKQKHFGVMPSNVGQCHGDVGGENLIAGTCQQISEGTGSLQFSALA
ncbi:MAG TPA: hypothetical protein VL403_08335 [Candidatus Kryptonia bacterium]|nr:hypothetical protein [Candidatus Kryptonia bacterium]